MTDVEGHQRLALSVSRFQYMSDPTKKILKMQSIYKLDLEERFELGDTLLTALGEKGTI